jgi:hypothetical protein
MERKNFVSIMQNSGSIGTDIQNEIEGLVKEYPYFQSAHILLLKALHDNADASFSSFLRNSALQIADREVLYNVLYSPEIQEPSVIHQDNPADSDQTVIESKNSDELIRSIENESGDVPDPEDNEEEIPQILMDDENSIEVDYNADEQVTPDEGDLLELDSEINLNGNNGSTEINQGAVSMLSQTDLIDRFIIANPRIEPIRDARSIPVEDRSDSPDSEGVFVSETLARIYISQGYYSKAIDIFEKLSLKYPEKSSYFATQIEKVKELLK